MKIKQVIFSLVSFALIGTACVDGYLDINDDPNSPTTAELNKLLTGAEYEVAQTYAPGSYLGKSLSSFIGHLTVREVDNYSLTPSTPSLGNTWLQGYVYALKNTDAVISSAVAGENWIYAGMGKLMKAYVFSGLVDLWGDIPYTEFNIKGNYAPKLDGSKDVYNSLLTLIDDGIADLKKEGGNQFKPAANDLFYNGDVNKWIRMGNTLKLRLLVQSRKAKSDITGWNEKLNALVSANQFMLDKEDFELKHTKKDNPDERHSAYTDEYLGGQSTYFISPWIYETMVGKNLNVTDNPFSGVKDPRVPYYWVNQIRATADAQNMTDYRDGAFVSLFFASNSSYAGSDQRSTSSFIGIYPCGGKFDDGNGGKCDAKVGTGVAPEKMLQAYSVPFMLAELFLTGDLTGNAKDELKKGIEASMLHVNTVAQAAKADGVTVPTITAEAITEYVNSIMERYDAAANNEEKLRIVMTQKWIANYFNPQEAYSDIRRTGYPKFVSTTLQFAKSPYAPDKKPKVGPVDIPLKGINSLPRGLWYPNSEATRNPNVSNETRNINASVVFWDK